MLSDDILGRLSSQTADLLRLARGLSSNDNRVIDAACRTLGDSGIFDAAFYSAAAQLPPNGNAAMHYLLRGWRAGLQPNPRFDGSFLLPYYQTAGLHGPPALTYALLREAGWPIYACRADAEPTATIVRGSDLFNTEAYLEKLGSTGEQLDPALHYVLIGERLGWAPSDRFDPQYYSDLRPDLPAAGICLLLHYLQHGAKEGIRPRPVIADLVFDDGKFSSEKDCVLLVSCGGSHSEAAVVALNLAQRLQEKYDVISVLLNPGDLVDSFKEISAQTICLDPRSNSETDHKRLIDSIQRGRRVRYAIISGIASSRLLPVLAMSFLPTITLVQEFALSFPAAETCEALGWSSQIVFPAQATAESFRRNYQGLRRRSLNILRPGVRAVPRSIRGTEAERSRVAAALDNVNQSFVVLGAGPFDVQNGVDVFLATAAAAIRLGGEDLHFVWAGCGGRGRREQYSAYLDEQIAHSGLADHVTLIDDAIDLDLVFAKASVLYLPARAGAWASVPIEATTREIPIICFEGASEIAEVLRPDPTATLTVTPYLDSDAAARVVLQLASDQALARRVGELTRSLVQRAFDIDKYVAQIDDVGREAIVSMGQWRADFRALMNDQHIDARFVLPPRSPIMTREAAVSRLLAQWSSNRLTSDAIVDFRSPLPGFDPRIYALHHPDLMEGDINPAADFIRRGRPEGPWLHRVVRPTPAPTVDPRLRTAIQAHFFYPGLIDDFLTKLSVNRAHCDLLLSTSDDKKAETLLRATSRFDRGTVKICIVPNRGRDVGPLLTAYGEEIVSNYDVVGHVHSKRSVDVNAHMGEHWREFLWQHLLGDLFPMMDIALMQFAVDEKLGLLFAEDPHLFGWDVNRLLAEEVASQAGLETPLPPFVRFPVGNMFWARTSALAPLIDLRLDWDDYPGEPIPNDGTILHALERLIPFAAKKQGYRYATLHIAGLSW